MRRLAPRPLASVLQEVAETATPATVLARVQACWTEVAGEAVSAEAEVVAERHGVLTIRCRSAIWAHELELLGEDLRERLSAAVGEASAVRELRFVVGSGERQDSLGSGP